MLKVAPHLHITSKQAEERKPGSMEDCRCYPGHLAVFSFNLQAPVNLDRVKAWRKSLPQLPHHLPGQLLALSGEGGGAAPRPGQALHQVAVR